MAALVQKPKAQRWSRGQTKAGKEPLEDRRTRTDSGYFEEELSSTAADAAFIHWSNLTQIWTKRAQSIITQESERLSMVNVARKMELLKAQSQAERRLVEEKWSNDFHSAVETTMDLMQCIVNDVEIAVSDHMDSSSSSLSQQNSLTGSSDLGKILEEELGHHLERKKQKKLSQRQQNTKLWIENELVGQKTPPECVWSKSRVSSTVWKDEDQFQDVLEVEDIFADWRKLQPFSNKRRNKKEKEVNAVFWNISMEPRKRRISEVLENLSLFDSPDIFEDRCELLETGRINSSGGRRPPKCYWNIFSEWKHNLKERPMKRKRNNNRRRSRPKRRPFKPLKRFIKKLRPVANTPEDFFFESIDMFAENASLSRRRSREEDWDDDRQVKRLRGWDTIQRESEKSFKRLTRGLEARIRQFFRQESCEAELKAIASSEDFRHLPEDFNESRTEFDFLRDEVRRIRKARRSQNRLCSDIGIFHEWLWNLDHKLPEDDPLSPGESMEDIFGEWSHNLTEQRPFSVAKKVTKRALDLSKPIFGQKEQKQRFPQLHQPHAMKQHRHQMNKCYPKQPMPKSRAL